MNTSISNAKTPDGPPLLLPAVAFAVLTIAAAVLGAGAPWATASSAEIVAYTATNGTAITLQALLMFGSAFPLAVWAAAVQNRLRASGATVPGPTIGLVGGVLAAGAIMLSALCAWASAQPAVAVEPAAAATLRTLAFAAGAAGFVAPLGLMLAGFAVPVLLRGAVNRGVAWAGLVVAAAGLLAAFTLFVPALNPVLPIGRFGGLIWIVVVSVLMPAARERRPAQVR